MGNKYGAQNMTSYFVYELNEMYSFVNQTSLQHLLAEVEEKWQSTFGHSAFQEKVHSKDCGYVIKEVYEAYKEHGSKHISLPATEIYLRYGTFQLIERTYSVPVFTPKEQKIIDSIINQYRLSIFENVS